ncbi:MAG TPA: glutaminyl-peptide cyclotransferase, partial [Alphaproteobacteria bacterium]|nr:glutaminyl-peptide cyclotransferase [Alphaproteobacteria bacterium]
SDMRLIRRRLILAFLLTMPTTHIIGQSSRPAGPQRPREYTFKVVNVFPHDTAAFTQGLVYHDGFFYEGTGLYGRSSVRKVRLETGEVVQHADLPTEYFGEGIAIVGNKVIQLTWQSHIGFVYSLSDFKLLRQFSYPGEGWGLTSNGNDIFMSDGSAQIRVLNAATLKEKRRFTVRDGGTRVDQLNELEYVEGEIFANIWQTDRIARISPVSGKVVGWIDLTGLLSPVFRRQSDAVLNGIAYDAAHKRLFVTGKLWPSIFEIQLVPKNPATQQREISHH